MVYQNYPLECIKDYFEMIQFLVNISELKIGSFSAIMGGFYLQQKNKNETNWTNTLHHFAFHPLSIRGLPTGLFACLW